MLGNIILLLVSLLILRKTKLPDDGLGLRPGKGRLLDFIVGIGLAVFCAGSYFLLTAHYAGSQISLNNEFGLEALFAGIWYVFNSVLFEELLFRGVVLLFLIRILGASRACLLSAAIFGVYHWFSYGVLGQPVPMAYVFLVTAAGGWVFAYAFASTRSLYMPVGLHLGWNIIAILIFSQGPLGDQLLKVGEGVTIGTITSLKLFLYQLCALPLITILVVRKGRLPDRRPLKD